MTIHGLRSLAVAAVAVAAAGCSSGDFAGDGETVTTVGAEPMVDWDTYRASAREIPGHGLLVEFDLLFPTEEALYEHWQKTYARGPGEALTVHTMTVNGVTVDDIWPSPERWDITYCVSPGFTSAQMSALLPALDQATGEWGAFLGLRFRRVTVSGTCDENNNQVFFNVRPATYTNGNYPSVPRNQRIVNLDSDGAQSAFVMDAYGVDLVGTLRHELGHIIGLVHEHKWNPNCPSAKDDANTPARQLTPYDQMSVENYPTPGCRNPTGGGFYISPLDVYGTVNLYGLAPALVGNLTAFTVL